jgi:hypothetical protein
MNADARQAQGLIHRIDSLDLPHIDQMSRVSAFRWSRGSATDGERFPSYDRRSTSMM